MKFIVHFILYTIILLCTFKLLGNMIGKRFYDYILPPVSTQSVFNQKIAKEALLDTTHLIQLYGYPAENHTVLTDDGYLITLHRIPSGKKNRRHNGIPIYLQHGAWICSSSWVDNGEESWGFLLAEAGYDVWLGNFRDNSYTRKLTVGGNSDEVIGWDKLSIHEVPSIVDYILNVTGFKEILAIGHSMGATAMFASLSINKQLNSKVKGFVAIAPVCNAKYSSTVTLRGFNLIYQHFPFLFKALYKDSNHPAKEFRKDLLLRLCPAIGQPAICKILLDYSGGYNPSSFNKTRLPIFMVHSTDSFPDRFFFHWVQAAMKNKMVGYDYGREKNIDNYKQATPTEYDLTKIKIPVAVINSANDALSNPFDVEILCRQLPNLIYRKEMSDKLTTHLDLLFHEPKKLVNTILPVLSSMWNYDCYTNK